MVDQLEHGLHFAGFETVDHVEDAVGAHGFLFELAGHGHHLVVEELSESFAHILLHASLQFLSLEALEESHGLGQRLHHTAVFVLRKAALLIGKKK